MSVLLTFPSGLGLPCQSQMFVLYHGWYPVWGSVRASMHLALEGREESLDRLVQFFLLTKNSAWVDIN